MKFSPKASTNLPSLEKPHYVGHRGRLKQRFLGDPKALPDYELLELLLYFIHRQKDTKPLAKTLLNHVETLNALFGLAQNKLKEIPGIGNETLLLIALFKEVHQRLLKEEVSNKPLLTSLEATLSYCQAHLGYLDYEAFYVLFLNTKGLLIREECLQKGTLNHTHVHSREVVKRCLVHGAASIIFVHNHPSGDPTPSSADIQLTKKMQNALLTVDIIVADHLIIGKGRGISLKKEGFL